MDATILKSLVDGISVMAEHVNVLGETVEEMQSRIHPEYLRVRPYPGEVMGIAASDIRHYTAKYDQEGRLVNLILKLSSKGATDSTTLVLTGEDAENLFVLLDAQTVDLAEVRRGLEEAEKEN